MADYTAPFHMPVYTDEEFRAQKAEYVEKNGYAITLPKFRDVIHIGLHKPMTEAEKILWYSGKRNEIPHARHVELQYQKERSREKYHNMLASPIPNFLSNITTFLTSWDDAQDAIISLAAIGRIACFFLPRFLVSWLAWPIGLLWFIAAIMSLLVGPSACMLNPMACKRYMRLKLAYRAHSLKMNAKGIWAGTGKVTAAQMKLLEASKRTLWARAQALAAYEKAKLAAGLKGYATSGTWYPSFVEGIQMAQVTDQIYGVGVSLGPLFGMAYDLMSGGVRWVAGQNVSFNNTPSDVEVYKKASDTIHNYARWTRPKSNMTKSEYSSWKAKKVASGTWGVRSQQDEVVQQAIKLHATGYGFPHRTNWQEEAANYALAEMGFQGVRNVLDYWDPGLNVEGLEHIQIEAYNNPNPLIEEMLREEGVDPEEGIGWPVTGKRWQTYEEIQTTIAPVAAANIRHFSETCQDERLKAIGEMSATAAGLMAISFEIGEQNVGIQFHAAIDIAETLLDKRYSFPLSITIEQIVKFALWTQAHEDNYTRPNLRDILGYAKNSLGFEFTTRA